MTTQRDRRLRGVDELRPHIWQADYPALRSSWLTLQRTIARCRAAGATRVLDAGCGRRPLHRLVEPLRCISMDTDARVRPDLVADNVALPFVDGAFDLVIASETLEHTAHHREAAREMVRVTRRGGFVYASVPFVYPLHGEPDDFQRPTEFELLKLFPDCDVVELNASNTIYSTWVLALQYALDWSLHVSHRLDPLRGLINSSMNLLALALDALARTGVAVVSSHSYVRRRLEERATHPRKLVGMLECLPTGYVIVVQKR